MIDLGNRRLLLAEIPGEFWEKLTWPMIFHGVVAMEQSLIHTRSLKKRDESFFLRLDGEKLFLGLEVLGPPQNVEKKLSVDWYSDFFIRDTRGTKLIEELVLSQLEGIEYLKKAGKDGINELVVEQKSSKLVEVRYRKLKEL